MKKTIFILAILAALLFVSCCCHKDEKNDEPLNINAQKLIGTWRYSGIVDLDSIAEAESMNLPIQLGNATFNYEWIFNEDKTTGVINAFLDYKGIKINAIEYPHNFEYTATESAITISEIPYKYNVYYFALTFGVMPIHWILSFGKLPIYSVWTHYIIEENKLTMELFGEYVKLPK
jgi:hypothetical protein